MNSNLPNINSWNALSSAITVAFALQGCTSPPPMQVKPKSVPVVDRSAKVLELRKQIRERDKRIEELESKLEALKLIDQDSIKQKSPLKPPMTLELLQ